MKKNQNVLILFFTVFFLNLVMSTSMADVKWPSKSAWSTDFNKLNIYISNGNVTGDYAWKNGKISGKVSADGKTLTGNWSQDNGQGNYIFTISSDSQTFSGLWNYGKDAPDKPWNGKLILEKTASWWTYLGKSKWETGEGKITFIIDSNGSVTSEGNDNKLYNASVSKDGKYIRGYWKCIHWGRFYFVICDNGVSFEGHWDYKENDPEFTKSAVWSGKLIK